MISGKSLWLTQYNLKYNALWEPSRSHDAVEGQFQYREPIRHGYLRYFFVILAGCLFIIN